MPPILPENVRWRLKQVHGGNIFDVNATDNYMVGRNQTAQISLNSNKTSRTHSSLVVNIEGHLLVQDLKSVNGTFVNGTQIAVYVLHRLFPGDTIGFGVADIGLSENDRDRQTFFVVIYEELPVQDIPPVEASLADSTTDLRGNVEVNSTRGNQSSARNSTAEIELNSFIELPSSSSIKKECTDIIEITSSTSDEEKPELDLDDCFEVDEDESNLEIADVCSVPERSPERKKGVSNNWLQKSTSVNKLSENGKFFNLSGGNNKKLITTKQVQNFFELPGSDNRKKICQDKKGAKPSTLQENSCDDEKIKSNLKKDSKNVEKLVGDGKIEINGLQRKGNYGVDSSETSNQGVKQKTKGLGDKQTTPEEKRSNDIVTSYLERSINVNKEAAKNPANVISRRKSLIVLNTETETDKHSSKNNKDPLRRKSCSGETRYFQKSEAEGHSTENDSKVKKPLAVPLSKKNLAVPDSEPKNTEHSRKKGKDTVRRKSVAGEESTKKQDVIQKTECHPITTLEVKKPNSVPPRKKSLLENAVDSKKKSQNSLRPKSISEEPRYTKNELVGNQQVDSYFEEHMRENMEPAKNSENKVQSKNSATVCSRRTSLKVSDAPGKKDEGERPLKCSSSRKSLTDDRRNKNKGSDTKNLKKVDVSSEKRSVHNNDNTMDTCVKVLSNNISIGSNDQKKEKNQRKSGVDSSTNIMKNKLEDDYLLLQLEQAISGNDRLSPPQVVTNNEQIVEISKPADEINKKHCEKKNESEERESTSEPRHKHKKVKIGNCGEEFLFNRHTPREKPLTKIEASLKTEKYKSSNSSKYLVATKHPTVEGSHKKDTETDSNADSKNQTKRIRDLGSDYIECSVNNDNCNNINESKQKPNSDGEKFTSFKEPSLRNISVLETTFTTDKDNSVIIDITNDDDDYDDMDFSCSQIFHMSQIVKSEIQDDTFQKIKNELAEMEFCEEETIINAVPIDVEENDMSGFENTQDICAYLEGGLEEHKNTDNFVSNEDNEELLNILGDFDKNSGNKDPITDAEDMDITVDISILPKNIENSSVTSKDELLHNKLESDIFFVKPKYVKPPVIEPHIIGKPKKDLPKKSPLKQDAGINKVSKSNKRKNSLEPLSKKKKLKGSPRSVAEPPRCDSKSIHMEFKKRSSGSKMEQDKLHKDNIRMERRKKLKEITERSSPPKVTETKSSKGNTVKVLPESKTRRGSYLCEEVKKSSDDTIKSKINRNSNGMREISSETSNQKKYRRVSKDGSFDLACKCHEPGTSVHQLECPVHKTNLSYRGTSAGHHNTNFDINDNHQTIKTPPRRSKTPTKDLLNYKLKPIDLPGPTSKYNLRRTKSSGDIKADLAKSNDQLRPAQSRYNLRHSTALENNRNKVTQDPLEHYMENDLASIRRAVPPYPVNVVSRPSYVNQRPQYAMPSLINQKNTAQAVPYHAVSRGTNDLSRRLMWSNGGASNNRRAPVRRLPGVDEVVQKMVNWLPNWLTEQVNIDSSAPVNSPPARKIPLNFKNFDQYYNTFSKLVLLENWQYLFKGFREGTEQPRKVKIEHVRVANDLMTMDCISYITQKELRQGLFYKPEDFVLVECVMNDKSNSYISLSFGFIQRCKKSIISNEDVISIRLGSYCSGEPHTKLEFSIVTRYQPGKELNMKKFPIVKLLANIRAHLMMIRAIKILAESSICSKILHPKINEYRFPITQRDIIQPHYLNPQQRTIVLEGASLCTGKEHGIYCIKGPPGTGKSTVIVHLVFQILFSHYVTKKTTEPPMILLAAPSNTAVDNLLSKLTAFKRSLPPEWDKHKVHIKCVRIGPESSISKEVIGYSLPKLAEKHMPLKHMEVPEFRAARDRNENLLEFSRTFFGDRYGYEIKACEDLIIEKSNIICTTLNSCINGKLIEAVNRGLIKFSCCIIDEATQCHEVEALLPTILGIDKFVLVGDPKQLNATIMNRDAFKLGFGESLFSRISNNFTNDPRTPIKMLTDQYRMHPEICAFPNKQFYEGKLKSFPKPLNKLPEQIRPFLVFNCAKINDSGDYTNIDEVNLIKKLLSTIFGMIDRNHKYTVGIITPYNAQKDMIGCNIRDLMSTNNNCKITVNTVDSFQGSENDIIIISCVRESTNSFLQNENRLNVALTRAKQALYIIGNYTLFKECRPLYDLREDAKKRNLLLDIRQDPKTIDNFSKYLIKKDTKK